MTTAPTTSVTQLANQFLKYQARKIFLVTGDGSYIKSGAKRLVESSIKDENSKRFFEYSTNPNISDLEKGVGEFREFNPDVIVAIGGGSAIDMAKLISVFSNTQKTKVRSAVESRSIRKSVPLIAIPTTAGSGSEATQFAVLYVDGIKQSIDDPLLLPDFVILDYQLTMTMSTKQAAVSGADALCQSIESYWSINSTEESLEYSNSALRLILRNIVPSVNDRSPEARSRMLAAANLAGKAINITRTTASHAVSYALTGSFGVPHGQAVALTIAQLLKINTEFSHSELNECRGQVYLDRTMQSIINVFNCESVSGCQKKIIKIFNTIGLATTLEEIGISTPSAIKEINKRINKDRLRNNPVKITSEDILTMLKPVSFY